LLRKNVLNWLESENRLKSSSHGRHLGLLASEAVCFLILEERGHAINAKRPILARISALGLKEEPEPRAINKSGRCTGLSEACHTALQPLKARELKAVFGDVNGEDARAKEWSIARMRCFKKGQEQPPLWKPAEYYGDIGATSGAVMTGIAAQGFVRNWLNSPVLIFCSDDHGPCGAVILEKETEVRGVTKLGKVNRICQ
jgi:3-oxoacyl-[acyl-carrier-protein] synthase-1